MFDPRTRRRPAARLALALAGGIPVCLWLAWLLGELTGCGRFAASCEPRMVWVAWLAGIVLVGVLVLLPAIAAVLAAGAAGALAVAVPATFILAATGGARVPDQSALVLGVVADGRLARRRECLHQSLAAQFGAARSRILSPCPAARTPATSRPRPRNISSRCA